MDDNPISLFAQRTLGSSGGKHCKSLEGMYSEKLFRRAKKEKKNGFSAKISTLFRRWFIAKEFEQR